MMNKEFGHRLWGASGVLFLITHIGDYSPILKIISFLLIFYFFWFGVSRFEKGYKKII